MRWYACRALARRVGLQPAPIEADDHTAEPAKTTMTRTVRAGTRTRISVPKTERAPRVQRADLSFRDKEARVTFDPARVTSDQRIQAVDQLGFHASLKAGG